MSYILSIIANPAEPVIDRAFLDRLSVLFPKGDVTELAEGIAYDIVVDQAELV